MPDETRRSHSPQGSVAGPSVRHVRVFVSSPGDLARERRLAREIVDRLGKDAAFRNHFKLDPVLWDDPEAPAPMLANLTAQESVNRGLVRPSECDIVITILWGRIGTPLQTPLKSNGTFYLSGTEWEYEDARRANRDILLYRRTAEVVVELKDPRLDEKRAQQQMVERFFEQVDGGYTSYERPQDFARLLESNLRSLLVKMFERADQSPDRSVVTSFGSDARSPATEAHHPKHETPPRTRCFGRRIEIARLVRCVLNQSRKPICILGGPGIGKTTIAFALRDEEEVRSRFGDDIYFVRCDAVNSAEVLAQTLCRELGVELGENESPRAVFVRELKGDPTLLVIDNLETPWEKERDRVQDLLRELAEVPNVWLVVTIRGNEPPSIGRWQPPMVVRPLDMRSARQLFLDEAQNPRLAHDALLNDLLHELDGVPLAVRLLANNTHGEPSLKTVSARWKRERTRMLRRSVVTSHQDSLEASLELSLSSPRMTDAGRRLLGILATLPEGVDHRDLDLLLPDDGLSAAAAIRKLALALDERERLSLLSPVREFVTRQLPCNDADTRSTMAFYRQLLIRYSLNASPEGAAACIERLQPELRNIEAAIDYSLVHDQDEAIATTIAFAHVMRYTGLGTTAFLEKVLNATARN